MQASDRNTGTDTYRGPLAQCYASILLRGTFGTGTRLGWVVTSSTVKAERKGIGLLAINWEVGGPDANPALLPLADFRSEEVELYPKVERNPQMFGPGYPGNPNDRITAQVIAMCYGALHHAPPLCDQLRAQIETLNLCTDEPPEGTTWADQWLFATLLLDWLDHGNETYYLAGTKYSWIWYTFVWPTLSNGGIIVPFPTAGPRMGDASLSWLQLADNPEPAGVNGSVYKITSTWLGGPNGHWDPNLYKAASH
jgi:hypothetical protein